MKKYDFQQYKELITEKNACILDANLLLVYLIYQIDEKLIKKFQRTSDYIIEDGECLTVLLKKFGKAYSTPHVLTEVSNLAGKLADKYQEKFRQLLAEYINTITESFSESQKVITSNIYMKLGLTDAALCFICEKEKLVLITADFALANTAQHKRIQVINFNHIRQQYFLTKPA